MRGGLPLHPLRRVSPRPADAAAKVIKVNSVNLSVEVVPVIRQNACIGAFALLQRFNDVEVRQNELRGQLLHKGYYAKYSFDDVIGQSAGHPQDQGDPDPDGQQ